MIKPKQLVPRDSFRAAIGLPREHCLRFIVDDCSVRGGFCAQTPGFSSLSRSSSASVVYALWLAGHLTLDRPRKYLLELRRFMTRSGSIYHVAGKSARNNFKSSWTTALVGLALDVCGATESELRPAAEWLVRTRRDSGLWAFCEGTGDVSWMYTFYAVLFLRRFRRFHEIRRILEATARQAVNTWSTLTPAERLLARVCRKIGGCALSASEESQLAQELNTLDTLDVLSLLCYERTEPLFYFHFLPESSYLLARKIVALDSRFSVMVWTKLRENLTASGGWGDGRSDVPYSWSSALSLATAEHWCLDLQRAGIPLADIEAMARNVTSRRYNIAISFSGVDRDIARKIFRALRRLGLSVFFDEAESHTLLGENLAEALQMIYRDRSDFVVIVLSRAYLKSLYAFKIEWKAIVDRAARASGAYILPYQLEPVEIPGLSASLAYIPSTDKSPQQFAEIVHKKWRGRFTR